jgi:ribosomal 50S subunit-associated protein YjgA (DUF615 family)
MADLDDDDATSRGDLKRARRVREDALSRLATDLVRLSAKNLERLALPESVLEAVYETQRISSLRARGRQLRVVRGALRDEPWPEIRAKLDQLLEHGTVGAGSVARDARSGQWMIRLIGEGQKRSTSCP